MIKPNQDVLRMSNMPFGVSVIIPAYRSEPHLRDLLESLRHQTLPSPLFEVLLLINGPDEGASDIAETFSDLPIELHHFKSASVSFARNQGIRHATFQFLTFIDADDTVSPNYLENLLLNSSLLGISIAHINEVTPEGMIQKSIIEEDIQFAQSLERLTFEEALSQLHRVLTMTTCKLIPTSIAQQVAFKHHLKSGEDVVFFSTLYSIWQPEIRIAAETAVYFRTVRPLSVSRQPLSYTFNVKERCAVLQELYPLLSSSQPALNTMLRKKIRAQWHFILRYAQQYPFEKEFILQAISKLRMPPSEATSYHEHIALLQAVDFETE